MRVTSKMHRERDWHQSLYHDGLIDRSTLENTKNACDTMKDAFLQGISESGIPYETRGGDYEDLEKTFNVFEKRLLEILGRLQYVITLTSELFTGDGVRVPGSEDGSHLCIYASVNGVATKVMTIQNTEGYIMEVFIYEPFPRMNLCIQISGVIEDHTLRNVKVDGFCIKGHAYIEDIDDAIIEQLLPFPPTPEHSTVTTPEPPLLVRSRMCFEPSLPSSSRNLSDVFAECTRSPSHV
jgi:hypothetical protein